MAFDDMNGIVAAMVGERYADVVPTYVEMAQSKVVSHLFPFDGTKTWDDVPERYWPQTCEIAVYLIGKIGAEGETSHRENGTSRGYESASIPPSMLRGIVPFAGVPK